MDIGVMSSKTRSKDKKLLRKKSNEYLCALEQFCRRAQDADDMMENLKLFSKYEKNNLCLRLIYKKSELLSESEQKEIFRLLEENMRHLYEQSAVGWIKKEKWSELFDPDARYIIAFDPNDTICGFVHLRFVVEDNQDVLYCYEIQINKRCQSKGLGTFLMKVLELIAFYNGFSKVMLTVFDLNKEASLFYKKKLAYSVDAFSPADYEECDYEILSKVIKANPKVSKPVIPPDLCCTSKPARPSDLCCYNSSCCN